MAALGLRAIEVIAALRTAGIHLASLVAGCAVFASGVGIAMQRVAENVVSGLILVLARTIRVGDVLEFDGRVARVLEMGGKPRSSSRSTTMTSS